MFHFFIPPFQKGKAFVKAMEGGLVQCNYSLQIKIFQQRTYILQLPFSAYSKLINKSLFNYIFSTLKKSTMAKGAGSHPTGSAVLSDISALTYDYKYAYKKLKKALDGNSKIEEGIKQIEYDFPIKLYIRFQNREELKGVDVLSIEEEYKLTHTNYIIANVKFNSLVNIFNKRDNKLFLCAI